VNQIRKSWFTAIMPTENVPTGIHPSTFLLRLLFKNSVTRSLSTEQAGLMGPGVVPIGTTSTFEFGVERTFDDPFSLHPTPDPLFSAGHPGQYPMEDQFYSATFEFGVERTFDGMDNFYFSWINARRCITNRSFSRTIPHTHRSTGTTAVRTTIPWRTIPSTSRSYIHHSTSATAARTTIPRSTIHSTSRSSSRTILHTHRSTSATTNRTTIP
jgi:hypothetical protein